MSEILTAREFNQRQTAKWHEDCHNWKVGQGGFPFLGLYVFNKNYGFVLSDGKSHRWFKTKREAKFAS